MIAVNFNDIKRRLYADGCTDLMRGVACLRWALLAGERYEEAVRPWRTAIPELFDQGKARERQRSRQRDPYVTKAPFIPGRSSYGRPRNRRHVHA